jgi:hypothetical protein
MQYLIIHHGVVVIHAFYEEFEECGYIGLDTCMVVNLFNGIVVKSEILQK